jgi:hypothetical protein
LQAADRAERSHVKSGAYHMANGNVKLLPNLATAENSFNPALPGQVGVRNFVRGDGVRRPRLRASEMLEDALE